MHFNCLPEYVMCVFWFVHEYLTGWEGGWGGGGKGVEGGVVYLSQA